MLILTFTFRRVRGGTRPAMVHANVPDANAGSIGSRTGGWRAHSWRLWKAYLKGVRSRAAAEGCGNFAG